MKVARNLSTFPILDSPLSLVNALEWLAQLLYHHNTTHAITGTTVQPRGSYLQIRAMGHAET